jgi:hypothetical protein
MRPAAPNSVIFVQLCVAILIISLRCRRLLLLLYIRRRAYRFKSVYIFQHTQAARTNPIHLTRWPFWLMQLTVRRRQTLCAWFGLYNVACFHLKHFMPRWWSLSTWLPRVYRAEHITPSQSENFNPQNTDRIHERSSKNGGGVYAAPHHTSERRYGSGRACNPQMNTLPPPATPVTHSASTETSHSTLPDGRSQALISVVCRVEVPAGNHRIAHAHLFTTERETGNGSYLVAILVLHTHKQTKYRGFQKMM